MAADRWDPFRDMVSLRDAVSSLLQESYVRAGGPPGGAAMTTLPLDVLESETEFVVKASLPGARTEHVLVTLQGDTLTIRGEIPAEDDLPEGHNWLLRERKGGVAQRSLSLAVPVDPEAISAHFEHGVLTLRLPKANKGRPRHIKINAGGNP